MCNNKLYTQVQVLSKYMYNNQTTLQDHVHVHICGGTYSVCNEITHVGSRSKEIELAHTLCAGNETLMPRHLVE